MDYSVFSPDKITLAWNANRELYLGGYRLYYGPACRTYTSMVDVGNQTIILFDLGDSQPYYFAVTAYIGLLGHSWIHRLE